MPFTLGARAASQTIQHGSAWLMLTGQHSGIEDVVQQALMAGAPKEGSLPFTRRRKIQQVKVFWCQYRVDLRSKKFPMIIGWIGFQLSEHADVASRDISLNISENLR